ncbi:PilN domain-containing protein [Desulfoplanes sp.]
MITINLLPQKRRAKISRIHLELFWSGTFLVCLLVGMGIGYYFIHSHVDSLQATKKQRQSVKSRLLVQAGRVNTLKKELKELEVKISAIRVIRIHQGLPVRYVDEIVSRMPKEKIWLEAFSLNGQGKMEMKGVALDNQAFASYADGLRQSPFIARVTTRRTKLRTVQGLGLIEFQCAVSGRSPGSGEGNDE